MVGGKKGEKRSGPGGYHCMHHPCLQMTSQSATPLWRIKYKLHRTVRVQVSCWSRPRQRTALT